MATHTSATKMVPVGLDDEPWPGSLTRLVAEVTTLLGDTGDTGHLVLVVQDQDPLLERAGAVREALRSLIHASVLERPERRVNLVLRGNASDRDETIAYLSSAEFVLGATIDLGARA